MTSPQTSSRRSSNGYSSSSGVRPVFPLLLLLLALAPAVVLSSPHVIPNGLGTTTTNNNKCPQPSDPNYTGYYFSYGDSSDCSRFYICVHGNPLGKTCPAGTVYSEDLRVCVHEGSKQDKCTVKDPVKECEKGVATLIPHPTACQRYFNCSKSNDNMMVYSLFQPYEMECPFPQLFDSNRLECVGYSVAVCGQGRVAATWECDYLANKCSRSHCMPCSVRYPSCKGRADGQWPSDQKLWSPYFVTCKDQRSVSGEERCDPRDDPQVTMSRLFHPEMRKCVTLWEIPRNRGGLEPSCVGKDAGIYYIRETRMMLYTCPGKKLFFCNYSGDEHCAPFVDEL